MQTITVPSPQSEDVPATAPVQASGSSGSGPHLLERAASCPPPSNGADISPVINGHEPETRRLKSIIKKTTSDGNTYAQSGDAIAPSGTAVEPTKQPVSSKSSSVGSERKGLSGGRGCCILS